MSSPYLCPDADATASDPIRGYFGLRLFVCFFLSF